MMTNDSIYSEKISSNKTELLFLALAALFLGLSIWRVSVGMLDILTVVFFCLLGIFVFYSLNFRTLKIEITSESLQLVFGIFTWGVSLDNIQDCCLDELPVFLRLGGAGIHFMSVRKRYRASFNFLEYPRVVIALKKKAGLVRDVSFSTRQPDSVLRHLQEILLVKLAA